MRLTVREDAGHLLGDACTVPSRPPDRGPDLGAGPLPRRAPAPALRDESPPCTIPNATLVAKLGAEVTFTIRAFLARAGCRSTAFDEITVAKA